MAYRVTTAEVKEIITTALDVQPFIIVANMIVTRELSTDDSVDDLTLKEIERWLSAHFICARELQVSREKIGDAEIAYAMPYQGVDFVGLKSTTYGRQALVLDPTGKLNNLNKQRVGMGAMGPVSA